MKRLYVRLFQHGATAKKKRCCRFAAVGPAVTVSVREHNSETICPILTNLLRLLPISVARSFFGGVALRYVLPVL